MEQLDLLISEYSSSGESENDKDQLETLEEIMQLKVYGNNYNLRSSSKPRRGTKKVVKNRKSNKKTMKKIIENKNINSNILNDIDNSSNILNENKNILYKNKVKTALKNKENKNIFITKNIENS